MYWVGFQVRKKKIIQHFKTSTTSLILGNKIIKLKFNYLSRWWYFR